MAYSKLNGAEITNAQYEAFKEKVKNDGVIRKIFPIAGITLVSDKFVIISGIEFEMTEIAFKSLIRLLGLSSGFLDKINSRLGDKVGAQLLSMMKTALSTVDGKEKVCVLASRQGIIVDFTKDAEIILSNNAYFSLLEDTMNNNPSMIIKNMAITENGNIEIAVLNNNWEFDIPGLNDEHFKSGLVFINTPSQTIINPFNERLVCTNGMVSSHSGSSLILKNGSVSDVNGFFDAVRNLKGVVNFEVEFKQRVTKMINTTASYGEVLDVRECVENHILNMKDPDVRDTVESFIPTVYIKQAFLAEGIDLNNVDKKSYKKINTDMCVWDLVNKLTDLASHTGRYGLALSDGDSSIFSLQRKAGELSFKPQYDLESPVKQIFDRL